MITTIGAAIDINVMNDVLLWWDVACGCTDVCIIDDVILCRPVLDFDTDYWVLYFLPHKWMEFYNTRLSVPYQSIN